MRWSSDTQWPAPDRQKRSAAAGRETCGRAVKSVAVGGPAGTKIEAKATSAIACISWTTFFSHRSSRRRPRWGGHAPPLSQRMAVRRLAAACSDGPQGLAAICCPMLRASKPHKTRKRICLDVPGQRIPSNRGGCALPIGLPPHVVFVLRAAALRTCRAAQSLLRVSPRPQTAVVESLRFFLPCVLFPPFTVPSCPPLLSPNDRLEGPSVHNGFYSRLPAIPVALISNRPCSPVRCTLLLGSGGRTPQTHMPASISLPSASASTGLLLVAVLLALPTTDFISDAISPPWTHYLPPSARPRPEFTQKEACVTKTRRRLVQRQLKPRLHPTARTPLLASTV